VQKIKTLLAMMSLHEIYKRTVLADYAAHFITPMPQQVAECCALSAPQYCLIH
jgi:hypothetical protein